MKKKKKQNLNRAETVTRDRLKRSDCCQMSNDQPHLGTNLRALYLSRVLIGKDRTIVEFVPYRYLSVT